MIYALKDNLFTFDEAFDICLKQKVLPKISGSSSETLEVLVELFEYLNDYKFKNKEYPEVSELLEAEKNMKRNLSNEKLIYMIRRFIKDGFTSFWR